jgi:uncharacterized membrane protein
MESNYTSSDDRLWAMLSYVLAIFFPIVAPLVVFLVKRTSHFAAFHSMQSLLLQGALVVLTVAVTILSTILGFLGPVALLALPLWLVVWVVGLAAFVFQIIAAIKSNSGEWYRIPVVAPYAERVVQQTPVQA